MTVSTPGNGCPGDNLRGEGGLYLTGKSGNRRRGPTRPRSGGHLDPGSRGTHSYPPMLLHKRTFGDLHRCRVTTSEDWGIGVACFGNPGAKITGTYVRREFFGHLLERPDRKGI